MAHEQRAPGMVGDHMPAMRHRLGLDDELISRAQDGTVLTLGHATT